MQRASRGVGAGSGPSVRGQNKGKHSERSARNTTLDAPDTWRSMMDQNGDQPGTQQPMAQGLQCGRQGVWQCERLAALQGAEWQPQAQAWLGGADCGCFKCLSWPWAAQADHYSLVRPLGGDQILRNQLSSPISVLVSGCLSVLHFVQRRQLAASGRRSGVWLLTSFTFNQANQDTCWVSHQGSLFRRPAAVWDFCECALPLLCSAHSCSMLMAVLTRTHRLHASATGSAAI